MTSTAEILAPLYPTMPDDYSQRVRPFTVVIAGPDRDNGEAPSVYVVDECSTRMAWAKALAFFMTSQETVDCYVIADESFQGVPDGEAGFVWNDLRAEYQRQTDIDDLADEADEAVEGFAKAVGEHLDTAGEVLPDRQEKVDRITAGYLTEVRRLVYRLSKLTSRS